MGRLPAKAQLARSARVVADRARGHSWEAIAKRHDLTSRQCMNIWAARGEDHFLIQTPGAELMDEIDFTNAAIADLAELYELTDNDSVKLGALKLRMSMQDRRITMKQAVGILPWRFSAFRVESELGRLLDEIVNILDSHKDEVPRALIEDVLQVMRSRREVQRVDLPWIARPLADRGGS